MLRITGHTLKTLARAALMLTVAAGVLTGPAARAADKGNILESGHSMYPGDWLRSNNGLFVLMLQFDGDLVLYRVRDGHALWRSGTHGRAVSRLTMLPDGNVVMYGYPEDVWSTGTFGHPGFRLALWDDGNLVICHVDAWSTGTNGQY
jgi:hypothetical protein